ncbi:MAG TPA: tripartite tricarboxylate transporter substrate binding protein [Burkholderiales bacterium]|nr:tripartite tricarboxylate transporter substrate binding protein [Burkholderiales bacterium]
MTRAPTQAAALLAASVSITAIAQPYPAKPVRIIVPFPAGGGSDIVGRILAAKLAEQLKQQFIVDNRGGAGGSIGTEAAARAAPDGYTMVLASTSEIAVNPAIYSRLTYDTVRDLAPIALIASTPVVIVVHPSLPAKSVKELIALARARPGDINMASAGNGTFTHLSGEFFKSLTASSMTHVPYKGAPVALTDLAAGQVQIMFSSLPAAVAFINAGKIRPMAVSTARRTESFPDVPTVMESGVPAYEVVYWYGTFMPAATPKEITGQLFGETERALRAPDVMASLAKQGAAPGTMTHPQFMDFVKAEHARWGKVARATGIKLD